MKNFVDIIDLKCDEDTRIDIVIKKCIKKLGLRKVLGQILFLIVIVESF